ncbi:hypothetical protein [Larkinella rosea]|nr:hypothetical protein [Larkinella rosea]
MKKQKITPKFDKCVSISKDKAQQIMGGATPFKAKKPVMFHCHLEP